jgi:diamine N-acetyltransferase
MTVLIRPAKLADAPALAAFGQKTFFDTFGHLYPETDAQTFIQERFSLGRTQADLAQPDRYVQLAFDSDTLVGFLDCGPLGLPIDAPHQPSGELYRLYVDATMKGSGLAQRLMEMALAWAKARGARALYLGVYCDNVRAQAFYRKYGFEIIGSYFFKVGETLDDERIMELRFS